MHRNLNSLISETPSLLFWILLNNNFNTRSKPTLATMMDVGLDSRADVNYISRSREVKLTNNHANKAELNAGHLEGFLLMDKKTKLISGRRDREKAEKVLKVRVSCDVISVL